MVPSITRDAEAEAIYANGMTTCCDTVDNVERVVVTPVEANGAQTSTQSYTVRVMTYELVDSDFQVYEKHESPGHRSVSLQCGFMSWLEFRKVNVTLDLGNSDERGTLFIG